MPPQLISIRIFLFPFSTIKIYPYYPCLRFSLSHNTQYTIYIYYIITRNTTRKHRKKETHATKTGQKRKGRKTQHTKDKEQETGGRRAAQTREQGRRIGVCVAPVSLLLSVARPAAAPVRFPVPTISASPRPLHASLLNAPTTEN